MGSAPTHRERYGYVETTCVLVFMVLPAMRSRPTKVEAAVPMTGDCPALDILACDHKEETKKDA